MSAAAVWLACADDDYGLYFNPRGEVVIRQEGQYHPDEDHWIYIQIENLEPLIDQLQRIASREIEPGD